jgi:ABC-2 type transport system ATP-binding protein
MNAAAIEVHDLTRRFDGFLAVDHVSFRVETGQVIGYLGPNGSGKTTTIRMLLGILQPSEGEAHVLGYDVRRQPELVRAQCGYMSQKFALYQELTARENLEFYAGVYGVRDAQRVAEALAGLGLEELADQPVQSLSAGWRQRLALAAAIIHRPRLLFLDEPTSGVDPLARRAFWDLIYALVGGGITAFVTTHYMDEAEYCGRIGIMQAGRLLALDSPAALKSSLPAKVWEVTAEPLAAALSCLETLPEVISVSLAGEYLRLITPTGMQAVEIEARLAAAALAVGQVTPVQPSMEDVFLTLSTSG